MAPVPHWSHLCTLSLETFYVCMSIGHLHGCAWAFKSAGEIMTIVIFDELPAPSLSQLNHLTSFYDTALLCCYWFCIGWLVGASFLVRLHPFLEAKDSQLFHVSLFITHWQSQFSLCSGSTTIICCSECSPCLMIFSLFLGIVRKIFTGTHLFVLIEIIWSLI